MTFEAYLRLFDDILNNPVPAAPYDNPDYLNYTKLNWSRLNRWLKTASIHDPLLSTLQAIQSPQYWIVITEPWCGDAAHIIPFLHKMAAINPFIQIDYELRDVAPFRIDQYLTNGGKSIPKLIIRDAAGNDLATWGPRPAACQLLYQQLMTDKADFEVVKTELQKWYNDNKGEAIQEELQDLLSVI